MGNSVDQFQPTIQVSPSGTVGVTWYDRRYDPLHADYDLAYTESTDGGATWSPNQRVSDVSSDADQLQDYKGICDIGNRKSLVYGYGYAMASWMDTRVCASARRVLYRSRHDGHPRCHCHTNPVRYSRSDRNFNSHYLHSPI